MNPFIYPKNLIISLSPIFQMQIISLHIFQNAIKPLSMLLITQRFREKEASDFYHPFVCVIIQFVTSLKNQKLIRVLKKFQNDNAPKKVGQKGFHYRLASDEDSYKITGYMHNAVTPFMFNDTSIPIVISQPITEIQPEYIWFGGGHVNNKISRRFLYFRRFIACMI